MCSLGRHWAAFIGVITAGCFIAFSGRQYRYRDGADAPAWDTNTEFYRCYRRGVDGGVT